MHTVIRYNRKGEKLFPIYWLVVQGHYKYKGGRYSEHLGYWFPKPNTKKKTQTRSIILNKNRTRYWLGEGAKVPKKATKHMSYFGLTTEPWISWGRKTLYGVKEREFDIRRDSLGEFERNYIDKVDEQRMKEESMENMLLRRVKLKERLLEEFEGKTQMDVVDALLVEDDFEDDEDILIRSSKYWALYKEYETIDKNPNIVHPLRKELLFRRLNMIAEQGFIDRERVSFDNPFFSIFNKEGDNIKIQPHADLLKREIDEDINCKDL